MVADQTAGWADRLVCRSLSLWQVLFYGADKVIVTLRERQLHQHANAGVATDTCTALLAQHGAVQVRVSFTLKKMLPRYAAQHDISTWLSQKLYHDLVEFPRVGLMRNMAGMK